MFSQPLLTFAVLALLINSVLSFNVWSRGSVSRVISSASSLEKRSASAIKATDKNIFGSKLLPTYNEDELSEFFKEFNITNFDIDRDPELLKWAPSKEFFEKFGFQNNTEKYKRKVQDVKTDFYSQYTKPILPQYKTFLADFMAVTFIQVVDSRYEYDYLHAFGICTQYYTVMKGYPLQDEIDKIFNIMMTAVGFDANTLRDDAKKVLTLIKEANLSEDDLLAAKEGALAEVFAKVRSNRFFKYTDAWGVGLGRVMELIGVEPKSETFDRWSKNLKWVFTPRLVSTWSEFCGDQLRMQGVEAMQKQLLIREKKRAASRLEKKASEFDNKKIALQELNEAIEERRQQLIAEQKSLKKKYEPDEYDRILKESV